MKLAEVAALLSAIWFNWLALLSAVFGVALTISSAFTKRSSAKRILLCFGLIALFLTPILVWRDEYRRATALAQKGPKLNPVITTSRGFENKEGVVVFVLLTVSNIGQAPTTATSFRMKIHPPRLYELRPLAPTFYDPAKVTNEKTNEVFIFERKDSIFEKMAEPIPPGAVRRGWAMYSVKGLPYADLVGAQITVTVNDVHGGKYSASYKMTGDLGAPVQPGITYPAVEPVLPKNLNHK